MSAFRVPEVIGAVKNDAFDPERSCATRRTCAGAFVPAVSATAVQTCYSPPVVLKR
jgi:hypothetical protein